MSPVGMTLFRGEFGGTFRNSGLVGWPVGAVGDGIGLVELPAGGIPGEKPGPVP